MLLLLHLSIFRSRPSLIVPVFPSWWRSHHDVLAQSQTMPYISSVVEAEFVVVSGVAVAVANAESLEKGPIVCFGVDVRVVRC